MVDHRIQGYKVIYESWGRIPKGVGICISKRSYVMWEDCVFFKINAKISLTTQDSQRVYVFDALMALFNYLLAVVWTFDT